MYLFSLFKTQDALFPVPHRDAEILERSHPTPDVLLRVSERQNTALNLKICHFSATREKGEEKKDPVGVKCIAVAFRILTCNKIIYLLIFKTIWAADAHPQSLAAIG